MSRRPVLIVEADREHLIVSQPKGDHEELLVLVTAYLLCEMTRLGVSSEQLADAVDLVGVTIKNGMLEREVSTPLIIRGNDG